MAKRRRNLKELINLSHSELENHYKTSVSNGIDEFLPSKIWTWIKYYFKSRFGGKLPFRFYPSGGDTGVYPLIENEDGKIIIAIASDWASNTKESVMVGMLMKVDENNLEESPDYSIHLGDIYYVGDPQEVEDNFRIDSLNKSDWTYGEKGFLALPGNHEFFSNGAGFYEKLLSKTFINARNVQQKAGFFCLENEFWRIIGLDTGYKSVGTPILEYFVPPKSELCPEHIDWLKNIVKIGDVNDKRGIIFLSHHQYYSSFEGCKGYTKPAEQLAEIFGEKIDVPVIWYWGHQHLLAIYDEKQVDAGIKAYGRCIGHGGMPVEITVVSKKDANKNNLRYYVMNNITEIDGEKIGYNGYMRMTLEGKTMIAKHILLSYPEDNDESDEEKLLPKPIKVLEEKWTINLENGIPTVEYDLPNDSFLMNAP